jgi:CheY-like chemotaxis protein
MPLPGELVMVAQGDLGIGKPLRILIVEDNPDGRQTLRTLLELLGHQVESAADGLEGVEKAQAWRPDVALVDIGLPRLNGYEVARRLRGTFGQRIFLVAHTGYGQPHDRKQGQAAGFDLYLVKPLNLEELCRWLGYAASRVAEGQANGQPAPAQSGHPSRFQPGSVRTRSYAS